MSGIMRRGALSIALIVAALATVAVAPSPASAIPSSCNTGWITAQYNTAVGAWSACGFGSGSHRVVVKCESINGATYVDYGPWRPAGQRSDQFCSTGWRAIEKGYETRSW